MGFIDQERVKRQQAAAVASEVLEVLKKELDPQVYEQLKMKFYAERSQDLQSQKQIKVEKYNQQTQKWEKFNAKPVQ